MAESVESPNAVAYSVAFEAARTRCPTCGSARTSVYRTMPAPRGRQRFRFRYHLCWACGVRFRSQEPCALEETHRA